MAITTKENEIIKRNEMSFVCSTTIGQYGTKVWRKYEAYKRKIKKNIV